MTITLKWCLLGRMKESQHPLWSCWCSRWDFVYVAWGQWGRFGLSLLEGTLFLNWALRAFGVKIGKRVYLGSGSAQVVDPDLLHFDDECTIMNHFQAHSFEDRVLKNAPVYVGKRSTIGFGAVVLYGAHIGDDSYIHPQSVVMKKEVILNKSVSIGAPIESVKACLLYTSPSPRD